MDTRLERFVQAQDAGGTYEQALAEIDRGRKVSHWMWFVFPQVAGLGRSEMARRYALGGLDEARAYLADPVLGPRLARAARAVLDSGAPDATSLMGGIDAVKLCSSMTLFEEAASGTHGGAWAVFGEVLDRYYAGRRDPATLARL